MPCQWEPKRHRSIRCGAALQLAPLARIAPNLVQNAVRKAEIQRLYAQAFTWRKEGEGQGYALMQMEQKINLNQYQCKMKVHAFLFFISAVTVRSLIRFACAQKLLMIQRKVLNGEAAKRAAARGDFHELDLQGS